MGDPGDQSGESPAPRPPGEITSLLGAAGAGSLTARERLLEIVYDELRVIARSHMRGERQDHTLGATALVNESYIRLFRAASEDPLVSFDHRHAFYKAAATAMRRILIDYARARAAAKRGGPAHHSAISVEVLEASSQADPHHLLALDEALSRLELEDERAAAVVRLRFFGGRQFDEIAEMLSISTRTAKREWEFARARLQELIEEADRPAPHQEHA